MEEVFVFGSNEQGFHGAGSAGYAMRGVSDNTWRTDKDFLKAMKAPEGSSDKKGKLAEFGVGRGFQEGAEGSSYAICTIKKPGLKRSVPLGDIESQICELFIFAKNHSEYTFFCTPIGCGYSGYTVDEMKKTWDNAMKQVECPENVILPDYSKVKVKDT